MCRPACMALLLALCVTATACAPQEESGPAPAGQNGQPAGREAGNTCALDPPAQPHVCTMEWDPVCGCDGKTYGNACTARGAGVPTTTPGPCEDSSQ